MRLHGMTALTLLVGIIVVLGIVPPPASAGVVTNGVEGPVVDRPSRAKLEQLHQRSQPLIPVGTNDPHCVARGNRSEAVILLHGTDSTFYANYAALGPALVADGWCVFGIDYGLGGDRARGFGFTPIAQSAQQVNELVHAAMESSGASGVHVIGFSQGASVGRWWVNRIDRGALTRSWIGIGSPTRGGGPAHAGTVLDHLRDAARAVDRSSHAAADAPSPAISAAPVPGSEASPSVDASGRVDDALERLLQPALQELLRNSRAIEEANSPEETVPGPRYTTISSVVDEMIWDVGVQTIHGENTQNLVLQRECPYNYGGHMYATYNPDVIRAVRNLLTNWQGGGSWGELACAAVPLGYEIPEIVAVDNLRKREPGATFAPPVIYVTAQ